MLPDKPEAPAQAVSRMVCPAEDLPLFLLPGHLLHLLLLQLEDKTTEKLQ